MHIIRSTLLCIAVLLSGTAIRADIISGIDTLRPWQGINFGTRGIRAVEQRQECDSAIEFFYAADDGCCLMVRCHCGLRFGALHGLYLSSKPLDSVELSHELALDDTVLFTPGDTLDSHYTCPASSNFFHGTGTQPLDREPYENGLMTADGNYVLLCVR